MPRGKIGDKPEKPSKFRHTNQISEQEMRDTDLEIRNLKERGLKEKEDLMKARAIALGLSAEEAYQLGMDASRFRFQSRLFDVLDQPLEWLDTAFSNFGDDKFQFSDAAILLASLYLADQATGGHGTRAISNKLGGNKEEDEDERSRQEKLSDMENIWLQRRY